MGVHKLISKDKAASLYKKNLDLTKDKLRNSVTSDNLIVQSVGAIDELQKVINILAKRLREWYSLYNPEFSRHSEDHKEFAGSILKKDRKDLLKEIGMDDDESIGTKLEKKDVDAILLLAKRLIDLFDLKEEEEIYIESLMKELAPNLLEVAGNVIGAKLIAHCGSLKRLMELPASTIQIIGAEKALFRHMRSKARCPKHGIILYHPIVNNVNKDMKGKAARAVADKISMAAKIDYFKGDFIGDKFKKELEEKFR